MFFISDYIRLHIKNMHKMTSDDYIDKYEKLESKSARLSCMICNEDMKHNLFAIDKHTEENHQIDALTYGTKYKLVNHTVTFQQYEAPSDDIASTSVTESKAKKLCFMRVDPKWYQGSQFQCRICSRMFYKSNHLLDHLKERHHSAVGSYSKTFGPLQTQSQNYTCQVCKSDVDHTEEAISR